MGIEQLSPREIEILQLAHLENAEIASQLCLSVSTIRSHWKQINKKLGVKSKYQAMLAIGAIQPPVLPVSSQPHQLTILCPHCGKSYVMISTFSDQL